MKINYLHIVFLLFNVFIVQNASFAQQKINIKPKRIIVKSAVIIKDSLTIIPSSIDIFTKDSLFFNKDEYFVNNTKVVLKQNSFQKHLNDTIYIKYKTLALNLGKYYYHQDSFALKKSEKAIYIGYDLTARDNNVPIVPSTLDYDGSFSRGFSIGNKQNLVLNSSLNLQMNGNIGSGIKLKAAISDANIPIQPEGSTQRLNEFDKVFIEISKDHHSLIAGDFELRNPKGYFSRYSKKLKGLKYSNQLELKNDKTIKNSVSFAISKGKFSRHTLKVTNGNQGPYKLKGANGERYLIVLSGTEKVYLDGKLLKRGRDFDYIIDYNIAEITFVNNMITENSRIIVEFEYSDQNYLKSLQTLNSTYGDSLNNVYFNFYNEQDSKNALGLIELDSADIALLKESGDSLRNSYRSGIRSLKDTTDIFNTIFYKKIFNPAINDSILVYTNNKDSTKYIAYFTDFGENNGSYAIDTTKHLNGRVYRWVGFRNGNYEPKIQLIPPEKRQLISLGTNISLSKNTNINIETSLSNVDKNRYSKKNNDDNVGLAALVRLNTSKKFNIKSQEFEISNSTKYEYSGLNFNPLNPYRSPEFTRDWNLSNSPVNTTEHFILNDFSVKISKLTLSYNYSGFTQSGNFNGNKHVLKIQYENNGFTLFAEGNLLLSKDKISKTNFFRPKLNISKKISFLNDTRLGVYYEMERNEIRLLNNDSLSNSSFNYDYYKFYLNTKNSQATNLSLYVGYRKDYLPHNNEFKEYTGAPELGIQGNWNVQTISKLSYNISFRQLNILNKISNTRKPESNILGKLQHTLNLLKGGIYANTNIEFGSGQQAKTEFVFVYAGKGQKGNYIWIDENMDSIKQNSEFRQVSGIDTANYVRVTQFNNEFQRINSTLLNNTFKINASKFFSKKKNDFEEFVSKLSFFSIFKMTQKTHSTEGGYLFPVVTDLKDTSLVSYIFNYNATLFYNRGDPAYDIHFGFKDIARQNFQVGGFTKNSIKEYYSVLRINYKSYLDMLSKFTVGQKLFEIDYATSGNYLFKYYSLGEEFNVFFSKKYGLILNYSFTDKKNQWGEQEKAQFHDLKLSGKILKIKKTKIKLSLSYVKIKYQGGNSQLIELSMLNGLKDGHNYIWDIQLNKRLKNNLDIIFQYTGKKSQGSDIIHQGRMQARASF